MPSKVKKVFYESRFVPAELISACGFEPVRITPADDEKSILERQGLCPYAHSVINRSFAGDGLFIAVTSCDQMRRGFELIQNRLKDKCFLLNSPSGTGQAAFEIYLRSLKRMVDFLKGHGGIEPNIKLAQAKFTKGETNHAGKVVIGLIGGPFFQYEQLYQIVKAKSDAAVVDLTESGLMGQVTFPDDQAEPFQRLARGYFNLPSAGRRPDKILHDWLGEQIEKHKISGLIMVRYVWCDLWAGQLFNIKERTGLNILKLDMQNPGRLDGRDICRIEAFAEAING